MDIAYKFIAKNSNSQSVTGTIFSKSRPLAFAKIKKAGMTPVKVSPDYMQTASAFFNNNFNARELSRFYATVGARMNNGRPLVQGLDDALEYLNDQRLKQAIMLFKQGIIDGQHEADAMMVAGFPRRDCLVIRSTADTGKIGDTFLALSVELKRKFTLESTMKATFRMPKLMSIFMAIFMWVAVVFLAPMTLSFLKNTGLKIKFSAFLDYYFKFVGLFNSAVVFNSLLYLGIIIGIGVYLRSKSFRRVLDSSKSMRALSLKSDHAALWTSFGLLYNAAVPAKEACIIVGDAANRDDSKQSFYKMGKLIESGLSLEDAVNSAGFPRFVVSEISSASSGGDIVEGINSMVSNLHADIDTLTGLLQENAKIFSVLLMGTGILIVFILTYYPMLSSVLSNV